MPSIVYHGALPINSINNISFNCPSAYFSNACYHILSIWAVTLSLTLSLPPNLHFFLPICLFLFYAKLPFPATLRIRHICVFRLKLPPLFLFPVHNSNPKHRLCYCHFFFPDASHPLLAHKNSLFGTAAQRGCRLPTYRSGNADHFRFITYYAFLGRYTLRISKIAPTIITSAIGRLIIQFWMSAANI